MTPSGLLMEFWIWSRTWILACPTSSQVGGPCMLHEWAYQLWGHDDLMSSLGVQWRPRSSKTGLSPLTGTLLARCLVLAS